MDEAHQILLNALEQAGVVMPIGVATIQDVGSGSLVSICSQSLILINEGASFPTSLPVSMADRFRLCTDLATAIKQLGYRGDLSFHQFLYPSEEDTYKLLKFMLERLSRSSLSSRRRGHRRGRGAPGGGFTGEDGKTGVAGTVRCALQGWVIESNQDQDADHGQTFPFRTCALRLVNVRNLSKKSSPLITLQAKPKAWLCPSVLEFNSKNALKVGTSRHLHDMVEESVGIKVVSHGSLENNNIHTSRDELAPSEGYLFRSVKYSEERDWVKSLQEYCAKKEELCSKESGKCVEDDASAVKIEDHENENYIRDLEEKLASLTTQASQMVAEAGKLQNEEVALKETIDAKRLETQLQEEKNLLLKAAVDMALDSKHPEEYYLQELEKRVEARKQQITALELQWDTVKKPLEEKKASLETSLNRHKSEIWDKTKKLKAVQQEIKGITTKILKREEEQSSLSLELEKAPKVATRNTYIRRITELIKNSKKQDADIVRIIHETQKIQRESNVAQDRLRRTYALVDETVFRDAKKDPVRRQAYRLLTSIHENFNEIVEKVFSIDKAHREIAEYEAKLEAMERWHLDVSSVQVDLDAIWKENELLEKKLQQKQEKEC